MNERARAAISGAQPSGGAAAAPFTVERIVRMRERAPGLVAFATTRPAGFRFTPGHYARLGLGPEDEIIWRPYSIASAPGEERLAFELTRVPGGAFNSLFDAMRVGDPVRVDRRSFGFLTLAQVAPGGALWLIATGTGVAPFVSMLADPSTWKRHERVILVHSVRHACELVPDSIEAAMAGRPGARRARLQVIPVVTREHATGALHERIGALLRTGALEEAGGCAIDRVAARVMLCGNPGMIKDVRALMRGRGLEPGRRGMPGQLATEGYW